MSGAWAARRFWTRTAVRPGDTGGFVVMLDDRQLRTPAKVPLVLPAEGLAKAIAAEWEAQAGRIDPLTMPMTRAANAAIDKTAPQFDEVAALVADYAATDLLCYRATGPAALVSRQAEAWDPLLDWAEQRYGARLAVTSGVIAVSQPDAALGALGAAVRAQDAFGLTALAELAALSGSLVIALAATEGHDIAALWRASRVDEDWQAEQWGEDDEATEAAARKAGAFRDAARFWFLARS